MKIGEEKDYPSYYQVFTLMLRTKKSGRNIEV